MDKKIIVIVGPTGVGKTRLSVELASIFGGEVINSDAMQIYKGLDIGTAKIKKNEKKNIKHHLFDIKEVTEDYTIYDYQKDAREKIEEVINNKHIPILVGGSGLYIKAALYNYELDYEEEKDDDFVNLTNEEILKEIKKYGYNQEIDINNRKKLVRTLNKLNKNIEEKLDEDNLLYDAIFIGLTTDRETLYERINKRVDNMLVDLIDEVNSFYKNNVRTKSLDTAIGYKELYEFFDNKVTLKQAVENIKQNSRNYAKRQYTWFNNKMNVSWFDVDYENFNNTVNEVIKFIEKEISL